MRSEVETLEKNPGTTRTRLPSPLNSHLFPRTYSFPSSSAPAPLSLGARELIGFAKLITRIYISPRKRFSFLPWPKPPASLTFRRRRRRPGMQRGGRIILVEKFVITLTISVSLFFFLSLLALYPPPLSHPRAPVLASSHFIPAAASRVAALRLCVLGRHDIVPRVVVPCRRQQQPRHG